MRRLLLVLLVLLVLASGMAVVGGLRPARAALTLTVNSTADAPDINPGDGLCETAAGNNVCTLRAAIEESNAYAGADIIGFNITGAGAHTIMPASALPGITDRVVIDGTTQPGFVDRPVIEIDGSNTVNADGLYISVVDIAPTIRGLAVNNFDASGIVVANSANVVLQGNYVGTDPSGTIARPNGADGISVLGSEATIIGWGTPAGSCTGACNLVSGNGQVGIRLFNSSSSLVGGNYIGLDATGTTAIGNGNGGVAVEGTGLVNAIGDTFSGTNIIAGNNGAGVAVSSSGSWVRGNTIGLGATGAPLPNVWGVSVTGSGNLVGGTSPGEGNTISGNSSGGILLNGAGNIVEGNLVGSRPGGAPAGNGGAGIAILGSGNQVGDTSSAAGNTIAFNGAAGVLVQSGTGNQVRGNSIHDNGVLGIDLGADGVTANDPGDGDSGPNNLQNYPVPVEAGYSYLGLALAAALNTTPGTSIYIDAYANPSCDPSGYGEGATWLGAATYVTDGAGNKVLYELGIPTLVPAAGFLTLTATDPAGNTSEFSRCIPLGTDTDGDWWPSPFDNCPAVANPGQHDADGDGYGDDCDPGPSSYCSINRADVNYDGVANLLDLARIGLQFGLDTPPGNMRYDQNADNEINLLDLAQQAQVFGQSAASCP